MQYFSLSIFYALTWPDFLKIALSSRIRNLKTHNKRRTRISRWLGREIVVAGLPPLMEGRSNLYLQTEERTEEGKGKWEEA